MRGMDEAVTLEPADGRLGLVERLLGAADLPSADVRSAPAEFYLAFVDGEVVGVGGLEGAGSAGLLRSVAVREPARGNGVGTAICDGLEATAREDGTETLYLLTTTAADFFAARGYTAVDRSAAPAPVRETTQFAELCPASATCMRKPL